MGTLGLGMYLPGKLIQAEIGILLSAIFQQFYFPPELRLELPLFFYIIMIVLMGLSGFLLKIYEKKSSNSIPVSV